MLDPLALASWNVTESVGPEDGLAAFDSGTSSIAAAAANATKPRRFRIMRPPCVEEAPVAANDDPVAAAAARDGVLGRLPPSFVLRAESVERRDKPIPRAREGWLTRRGGERGTRASRIE